MIGELVFFFFPGYAFAFYFFKLKSLLSVFLLTFNVNVKGGGVQQLIVQTAHCTPRAQPVERSIAAVAIAEQKKNRKTSLSFIHTVLWLIAREAGGVSLFQMLRLGR